MTAAQAVPPVRSSVVAVLSGGTPILLQTIDGATWWQAL